MVATHHHTPPSGPAEWHPVDISWFENVAAEIAQVRPRAIVNAAYVQSGDQLDAITTRAPAVMAAGAEWLGARFVHVSSDIVFSGTAGRPYTEDDEPDPVNDYGRAKARADEAVASYGVDHVVVRTSILWGGAGDGGPQFRMLRDPDVRFYTAETRSPLRVDRLAAACLELTDRSDIRGVLNVAGADDVDRLELAQALSPLAGVDPDSLRGDDRPTRPDRAADCRLDSTRARSLLDSPLPGIHTDATT